MDLIQAIKSHDALPSVPVIARKILAVKFDSDEGERRLLSLIEQDPILLAKIIGLANSASIAPSQPISTARDAFMLLGSKRVQSVATSIAIMAVMTVSPSMEAEMHELWVHSIGIAFAMTGLSQFMPAHLRPQDDMIFLAGMLHDMGYLVLAILDPKTSERLHNRFHAEPHRNTLEIEKELLEVTHDELGAGLGVHWNLPKEIIAAIRYHHTPNAEGAKIALILVRMINMVTKLMPFFGVSEYGSRYISDEDWEALGISPSKIEEVKNKVDEETEQAIMLVNSYT